MNAKQIVTKLIEESISEEGYIGSPNTNTFSENELMMCSSYLKILYNMCEESVRKYPKKFLKAVK